MKLMWWSDAPAVSSWGRLRSPPKSRRSSWTYRSIRILAGIDAPAACDTLLIGP
jgi:hypothetical protein